MEIRCPAIDPALLRYLESAFPDRCPSPTANAAQVYGQVEVIRHLRATYEMQNEDPHQPE